MGGFQHQASQVALVVENLTANAGDIRDEGSVPGLGRSPGGGHDNPLQYSCPKNPLNRGTWWAAVHRVLRTSLPLDPSLCAREAEMC